MNEKLPIDLPDEIPESETAKETHITFPVRLAVILAVVLLGIVFAIANFQGANAQTQTPVEDGGVGESNRPVSPTEIRNAEESTFFTAICKNFDTARRLVDMRADKGNEVARMGLSIALALGICQWEEITIAEGQVVIYGHHRMVPPNKLVGAAVADLDGRELWAIISITLVGQDI